MTPASILVRAATSLLLGGTSALAAEGVQSLAGSFEGSARQAMGISADTPVEYQNNDGRTMDVEAFAREAHKRGSAAEIDKSQPGKVILRLGKTKPAVRAHGLTHLPDLQARDLTGRPVRSLDPGGRHTLLSFYFSACVPCIQEVPALNAFRETHPELNYLAVTFDAAADARKFVSDRKLNWPVVADAGGFLNATGIRSFPAYMLVAPDGRILRRGAGLAFDAEEETPGLAALEKFVGQPVKAPK